MNCRGLSRLWDYMALSHKVFLLLLLLSLSSVVYVVIFVSLLSDKDVTDGDMRVSEDHDEEVVENNQTTELRSHSPGVAGLTKCFWLRLSTDRTRSPFSVLIFTRCNRKAAHFAEELWRMGAKLLLIVDETCFFKDARFNFLSSLRRAQPANLSVILIGDRCNTPSLTDEILSRDVQEAHVIVERDDFRVGDSPHDLGDLNRCYVSLLEAVKSRRQPEMGLFFHIRRDSVDIRRSLVTSSLDFRFVTSYRSEDLYLCSFNYVETEYGDVMTYILYMYTSVYESLYGLKNVYLALEY